MTELSPQVVNDLTETVDHLNANHADSVLFIVEHVLGGSGVIDAEIVAMDALGADLMASTNGTDRSIRITWAKPIRSRADAQRELFAALDEARRRSGAAPPPTSLEVERATTPTLPTFTTSVAAVRDVSPNVRQVDLEGGLDGFTSVGGDQFVYLMVPRAPDGDVPPGWTMVDHRNAGPDSPLCGAYYTVPAWDPTDRRLTFWIVRHGHPSGVGAWADRCAPGDQVALWGPRHGFGTDRRASHYLFVADESGFAAVASLLESLASGSAATVLAETVDEDHQITLPGADITWLHRHEDPPGSDLLLDAVRSAAPDTADLVAWGAGESRLMTRIRRHLRQQRDMRATSVHMTGYWRQAP